jgi:hypothetical protein
MRVLLAFALELMLLWPASAQPRPKTDSDWSPLKFRRTGLDAIAFEAENGQYRLLVRNADDESHPRLWDSSITISNRSTGETCESQPLLVERVYAFRDSSRILIVSSNGSLTLIDIVDPISCKRLQRIKTLTESVEIKGTDVEIMPACECGEPDKPCSCSSGQTLRMKEGGTLQLDLKKSDALTLRGLGVVFRGNRKVLHPRTSQALLQ